LATRMLSKHSRAARTDEEKGEERRGNSMPSSDPRQVISAHVGVPRVVISETPVPGTHGWRSQQTRGMGADVVTLQFLKERRLPRRQVHAVAFTDAEGRRMRFTYYLAQDDAGNWRVAGAAGGSAEGAPIRAYPWVNLGGGGGPTDFYAGGTVLDNGCGVVRVRLTAANGTMMEDTVDAGLVLFVTDRPVELPLHADLYDRTGQVVGRHLAF